MQSVLRLKFIFNFVVVVVVEIRVQCEKCCQPELNQKKKRIHCWQLAPLQQFLSRCFLDFYRAIDVIDWDYLLVSINFIDCFVNPKFSTHTQTHRKTKVSTRIGSIGSGLTFKYLSSSRARPIANNGIETLFFLLSAKNCFKKNRSNYKAKEASDWNWYRLNFYRRLHCPLSIVRFIFGYSWMTSTIAWIPWRTVSSATCKVWKINTRIWMYIVMSTVKRISNYTREIKISMKRTYNVLQKC